MDYPTICIRCLECIATFYRALDSGDGDSAAAVFAPDALWQRGSQTLVGALAINDAIANRDAKRKTAHMLSNLIVQVDANTVIARYMTSVYAECEGRIHLEAILDCNDTLRLDAVGLRITSKRATVRLSGKK